MNKVKMDISDDNITATTVGASSNDNTDIKMAGDDDSPAPSEVVQDNDFTFVDLFAGVGGFACGLGSGHFENLKGRCLLASERDAEARWLYEKNHGLPQPGGFNEDINGLESLPLEERCDILCGGFPCQSFSQSTTSPQGFGCPKNGGLFFEIIRLLRGGGGGPREACGDSVGAAEKRSATSPKGDGDFSLLPDVEKDSSPQLSISTSATSTPRTPLARTPLEAGSSKQKPRSFLLENVPNLLKLDDGQTFARVKQELEACGYRVFAKVLNSAEVAGLPQNRNRLYIVGFLVEDKELVGEAENEGDRMEDAPTAGGEDLKIDFLWPHDDSLVEKTSSSQQQQHSQTQQKLSVSDILEDFDNLSLEEQERYRLSEHQWEKVQAHRSYLTSVKRRSVDVHGLARTLSARYRTGYLVQSEFVPVEEEGKGVSAGIEKGTRTRDQVSTSLTQAGQTSSSSATSSSATSPLATPAATSSNPSGDEPQTRPRFFTLRECARLQGFPESFIIENKRNLHRWYHQCGNAVCPPVVAKIAKQMLRTLELMKRDRRRRTCTTTRPGTCTVMDS
ncbi:unnamed protein product [Amoebophrya sp. A25]|nr:unnamed protein product [Amoebophrya sp. A25]|eukprot:GSA25T00027083001.1